ncbi:hypothetical protein XBKB1_2970006 [Xenorhabdus bovienii str. kraussei Becker Underwood]|uniref:Uncharacterized protein n=1 Tax=Xenorhabdus bovienii str. kraussei Becker Underwood TaxID=1398204 RepID=A0A077PV53_XENBV|nr:hypothetical protein XBKB1_2970006 [Xenorhabdus bovienii str. kraussei Becker Underwood]
MLSLDRQRITHAVHVTNVYTVSTKPGGGKVGFYAITSKLLASKPLPHP